MYQVYSSQDTKESKNMQHWDKRKRQG